ncbi:MAG: hypothetical protein ABI718_09290 [Acidobacteriota bacterium]
MKRPSLGSGELVILEGAQRPKDLVNEERDLSRVATGKVEEILRSTLQDDRRRNHVISRTLALALFPRSG